MLFAYIRQAFIYFLPGLVGGARRPGWEMGIPFTKTPELQCGFSMKCPSCPTICQQNA